MIKKVKLADDNFSNLTTLLVRHPLWHIRWHLRVCQNIQLSKARSLKNGDFMVIVLMRAILPKNFVIINIIIIVIWCPCCHVLLQLF